MPENDQQNLGIPEPLHPFDRSQDEERWELVIVVSTPESRASWKRSQAIWASKRAERKKKES